MTESTAPLAIEPSKAEKLRPAPSTLTPVEWVCVLVGGNTSVFLLGFSLVTGRFRSMFEGIGEKAPWIVRLAATWYAPTAFGLVTGLGLVTALVSGGKRRRVGLAVAAAFGVVATAAFAYAVVWPGQAIAAPGR